MEEKVIVQNESNDDQPQEIKEKQSFKEKFLYHLKHNDLTDTWRGFSKEKINPLTLMLVVANVVCLLVSNIIAVKTVALWPNIGNGATFVEFKLPAAVILYSFAIIISDVLCQVDYIWSRRSCHIGFLLNLAMVLAFTVTIYLPGNISGIPDQGMSSMTGKVLGSSWFMLVASMLSFYFGDLANDTIFLKLKKKEGDSNNKLIKRCILSTALGQLLDSSIFITFGLFLLPKWVEGTPYIGFDYSTMSYGMWNGWASVLGSIALQFVVKVLLEFILSPIIVQICKKAKQTKTTEQ